MTAPQILGMRLLKNLAVAGATVAIFWATFVLAAVNTLCDDDYWPDW
jgi:hypothetical protein